MLQIVTSADDAADTSRIAMSVDGVAMVTPAQQAADGSDLVMLQAVPTVDPSDPAMETILADLRSQLPESALVGGAPAENLDLQQALDDYLPFVVVVILTLRSEENTSELQSLMRISYAVSRLKKKKKKNNTK